MVQWFRHGTPKAEIPGSIPGQGTRSHMLQLKILCAETKIKISCAATETQHSQIDTFLKEKKKFASVLLPASRQAPGL